MTSTRRLRRPAPNSGSMLLHASATRSGKFMNDGMAACPSGASTRRTATHPTATRETADARRPPCLSARSWMLNPRPKSLPTWPPRDSAPVARSSSAAAARYAADTTTAVQMIWAQIIPTRVRLPRARSTVQSATTIQPASIRMLATGCRLVTPPASRSRRSRSLPIATRKRTTRPNARSAKTRLATVLAIGLKPTMPVRSVSTPPTTTMSAVRMGNGRRVAASRSPMGRRRDDPRPTDSSAPPNAASAAPRATGRCRQGCGGGLIDVLRAREFASSSPRPFRQRTLRRSPQQ